MSIIVRQIARTELAELLAHIHLADPRAAASVEKGVTETLNSLNRFPFLGTLFSRRRRFKGIRYKLVKRYTQFVILYRTVRRDVEVLHILRGRRDIAAILEGD